MTKISKWTGLLSGLICAASGLGWHAPVVAAPAQADFPVTVTQNNNTFKVKLIDSNFAGGSSKMKSLALEAKVTGAAPPKVMFTVSHDGQPVYYHEEKAAPYCLFGNPDKQPCTLLQVGDYFKSDGDKYPQTTIKTGDYSLVVAVAKQGSNTVDWQGSTAFSLEPGRRAGRKPAYGTGDGARDGNGKPLFKVDVIDPNYTDEGMRKIQIEVQARLANKKNNGDGIGFVSFRVVNENNDPVFTQIELSKPYCIFGEVNGSTNCLSLKVGDTWPQSTRLSLDDDSKKEDDPEIERTVIQPGKYYLTIRVVSKQNSNQDWNSNNDGDGENGQGFFILLP